MQKTPVVTVFLRHEGEVLLMRRSKAVGSYPEQWGAVAGHVENDPDTSAYAEIREETGLGEGEVTLARRGEPFPIEDAELDTRWVVHPYLFDAAHRDITANWEATEVDWAMPTAILRRPTVPRLWTSYERVAPSVASIENNRTHGAAYLSVRALEVLRDRAGMRAEELDGAAVRATARQLIDARPSMAVLRNRVHRVMHDCAPDHHPKAVEQAAHAAIRSAIQADTGAARSAAEYIAGRSVCTLSRSGTVWSALLQAEPAPSVVVAESRPEREGVAVAEQLAEQGFDVTLATDAAVSSVIAAGQVEVVLTGADTVLPSGGVVNKTGTRMCALAARREEVPFYVAVARDKIAPAEEIHSEEGPPEALYDGSGEVHVWNPTFDQTPADLVTAIITEEGKHAPSEVEAIARSMQRWRSWMDGGPEEQI